MITYLVFVAETVNQPSKPCKKGWNMELKRTTNAVAAGILVSIIFASLSFAFPTVHPTGVTIYKPDKCFNGYTLYSIRNVKPVMLLDMNGNVVHTWDISGNTHRLLPNGHLLALTNNLLELDWDGNKVWEYKPPTKVHHFAERLPNGNTILLAWDILPDSMAEKITDPERKSVKLRGSQILIVDPNGQVIWQWSEFDHFDVNKYSVTDKFVDWTHSNGAYMIPENHWYTEGHKEFKPGNVLLTVRHFDTCYIIDRDTKEMVWSYRGDYRGGLSHPHEAHMIEPNLPGAGNILIFDNGIAGTDSQGHTGKSFVLEINPITKAIVWKYESPWFEFFTPTNGSAQRLPNGNTFIKEDDVARIFEVTPTGEIVWEYIGTGKCNGQELDEPKGDIYCDPGYKTLAARTKRPVRYPYDYCPQFKNLPKPKELAVTPPKNSDWQLVPDALRQK